MRVYIPLQPHSICLHTSTTKCVLYMFMYFYAHVRPNNLYIQLRQYTYTSLHTSLPYACI